MKYLRLISLALVLALSFGSIGSRAAANARLPCHCENDAECVEKCQVPGAVCDFISPTCGVCVC
jgi:hypothetical protein